MPRPSNPDVRRRLLRAGLELMHRDGFAGAGVKDITDAAGVPKGSFYSYFPSKEALSAEVLTFYWDPIERDLLPLLAESDVEPTARIANFFRALADEHESHDFVLGCMIGRMALEVGGSSDPARAELLRILDRWDAAIASCVAAGQAGGSIATKRSAVELAAVIVEAWEGAALRGKVSRSRDPYVRFEVSTLPALLGIPTT
ncbi:TetR family transcriptional regulator C-terminal domain-containing protein [Microbacterium sp. NPDC076895]|uniref:TetR/AcrR family transcriptional regulator n=1 Tax=Microbacterium sp. NPDC076895 TaxID=3154957 RepID=UPI003448F4F8